MTDVYCHLLGRRGARQPHAKQANHLQHTARRQNMSLRSAACSEGGLMDRLLHGCVVAVAFLFWSVAGAQGFPAAGKTIGIVVAGAA